MTATLPGKKYLGRAKSESLIFPWLLCSAQCLVGFALTGLDQPGPPEMSVVKTEMSRPYPRGLGLP